MALDLTTEQKALGKANFEHVSRELNRRGFMKSLLAGAAVAPATAALYFGYEYSKMRDKPVRAALIGAGDEGGVLVGEHNPNYLEFVAYSDIRPYNQKRIFKGEPTGPRRGFNYYYGPECVEDIKLFEDYHDLLNDTRLGIEAVVIALPLHLHAPVAIDCLKAGKHVLCEKLMAWNIQQCKKMIEVADQNNKILTIGHQRHYSLLYAQALEAVKAGVLGDVKHIRALWHRNNSWPKVDKNGKVIAGSLRDGWKPDIQKEDKDALNNVLDKWGYKSMEELVRWRLYNRTGGGLMAELGSHQLDACSIFLGKVHPLAVSGVGGKMFYTDDREVDDHVYVTFEFPGPAYYQKNNDGQVVQGKDGKAEIKNRNDVVVVTYSSINTNSFESYGECLMGSRGTMVVDQEQNVYLYGEKDPNVKEPTSTKSMAVTVAKVEAGKAVLDSSSTTGGPSGPPTTVAGAGAPGAPAGPVSRGYREEMDHFAYCIRMHTQAGTDEERKKWQLTPRCHGRVAMADAIIALTANEAMKQRKRIEFNEAWFEAASMEVPDADMIARDHHDKAINL
jgi:predicted dehydrogenase